MGELHSLVQALRKLSEKNLSNLAPHPLYSGFTTHTPLCSNANALRAEAEQPCT
jgi:hypothetical protein